MAKTINPEDYRDVLCAKAFKIVRTPQGADDAVQDLMIALWLASKKGVKINYGYMTTALRNICLNDLRKYQREIFSEDIPESSCNNKGFDRVLAKQLFNTLSPNDKTLIAKRAAGYTFKEIGSSAKQRYQYYVRTKC